MILRLAATAGLSLGVAMALGTGAIAGPAQSYQYQQPAQRNACPPPLKFAAGACVRQCPAGYRDTGRTCRFRSMRR